MSVILDGKITSARLKDELKFGIEKLLKKRGITPKLAIVIVGSDPASLIYVGSKEKACAYVGMDSVVVSLSGKATENEIISKVDALAADRSVDGILVQLPLPCNVDARKVLSRIPVEKDVDGLTAASEGALLLGEDGFTACTPKGIIELLKRYDVPLCGKHAVVVGRSNMVGKPTAICLLKQNCTVTVCHSKTQNLGFYTSQADILVVAVGKKHLITADMVKDGATVVDVGMNRENGKLFGDVDFDNVSKKAAFISPVPGGVGLMTVTMLINNAFEACCKRLGEDYDELLSLSND